MWLLHTSTLKLHAFVQDVPDYIILSHTWGEKEVSFDDIGKPHAKTIAGYNKIVGCCRQAIQDGFEWAWIDTCCIDKRSSSELSEAINSMYKWYWQASICYAYLSDVSSNLTWETWEEELQSSRWFSRGWTLQELLAPDTVEFYNKSWQLLGTRARLVDHIQQVTRIDKRFLLNRDIIEDANIATKFSWAAPRTTTRVEDRAYCMLGLVQVNMPMLYGEGDRAFYRLQLEIIRQTNEHSIFAWQPHSSDWQTSAVLAPSPEFFMSAADITPTASRNSVGTRTHEMTNNGLRITLPTIRIDQSRIIALLDCRDRTGSM
ncbi:HET domain-containing protein [Paraphoma chrysanthemicola]|uniref:HET domain-containing protein n=1 Tax=Paraphoma chrysanthemicola TaxID=798071 RepID=A0A8K0RG57_9PLEO|nr:HET domain-containing protein [Paraphoma chrysanthemicola]